MKIDESGLITIGEQDGHKTCLGYLFNFRGHGVFSPDGKAGVTPEQAEAHNAALSTAEIRGLDENCQVGQYGTLYYTNGTVQTFNGTLVSDKVCVSESGRQIRFLRNGKQFRGWLRKDADCFNFKRVS